MLKLLICDDEKWIRYGLINTIDWAGIGIETVYEAKDGLEALEIAVQNRPDIIITDIKMPNLSGLELITELKKLISPSNILIISGFNDFEYAQEALRLGVRDYFLKPLDAKAIETAVVRIIQDNINSKMENTRHSKERELLKSCLAVAQKYHLAAWLDGKYTDIAEIKENLHQVNIDINTNYGIVITCMMEIPPKACEPPLVSIKAIEEMILQMKASGFQNISFFKDIGEFIIILFNMKLEYDFEALKKILRINQEYIKDNFGGKILIGVGPNVELGVLSESYRKSISALDYYLFYPDKNVFFFEDFTGLFENNPDMFASQNMNKLINYIKLGKLEECSKWADDFISKVTECKQNIRPEDVKASVANILEVLKNIGILTDADANLYNKEIYGNIPLQRLEEILKAIISKAHKSTTKIKKSIELAVEYIENNYNKSIKMSDVANAVHHNVSYFSRIFSLYIGENFTKYLTRIRIEKAKICLNSPNSKVYEVAEMVGYPDYRVFSRKFKQLEGISPGEYKDNFPHK